MTLDKSTPEELIAQFRDRYQSLVTENQQLSQKIKENEAVALKLLGAIEALEYLSSENKDETEEELVADE